MKNFKIAFRTKGLFEARSLEPGHNDPCVVAANCLLCCRLDAERVLCVPSLTDMGASKRIQAASAHCALPTSATCCGMMPGSQLRSPELAPGAGAGWPGRVSLQRSAWWTPGVKEVNRARTSIEGGRNGRLEGVREVLSPHSFPWKPLHPHPQGKCTFPSPSGGLSRLNDRASFGRPVPPANSHAEAPNL